MTHRLLASALAGLLATAGPVASAQRAAPPPVEKLAPMTAAERAATIEALAGALDARFVFPDTGKRYAAMLRAKAGSYAQTDPIAFGEAVTADLQAVAKDGHLRLAPKDAFAQRRRAPTDAPSSTLPKPGVRGLEETRMIGDVAYLRFNEFGGDPAMVKAARDFLLTHADAKAVIIDARPHRGGGLAEMDAMLPLLYARPATLLRMDTRASSDADGPFGGIASLTREPSAPEIVRRDHHVVPDAAHPGLQHVPVYYLISNRSASAAEHLALAFKRTGRATLVGETTRGAGHYGGLVPVGARFAAFIPVGRSYDPDTGWDWEGKGVAPDVAVPPDQALDKALELAAAAGAHPR